MPINSLNRASRRPSSRTGCAPGSACPIALRAQPECQSPHPSVFLLRRLMALRRRLLFLLFVLRSSRVPCLWCPDGSFLVWAFFVETADFCLPGFFGDRTTSCSSILPWGGSTLATVTSTGFSQGKSLAATITNQALLTRIVAKVVVP